jgi:nucleoside-diphosphate-sugar epimerase
MRVFVAGATGAIGKQLVPRLVEAGHEVHGMTRRESKQAMLHELGAVPVVADALDPDQVAEAVGRARPEVIVHQLTALAGVDIRHPERGVAMTNRVRTEGTDHLLSAGQAVGVRGLLLADVTHPQAMRGPRCCSGGSTSPSAAHRPTLHDEEPLIHPIEPPCVRLERCCRTA